MTTDPIITDRDPGDESDVRVCGAQTTSGWPCQGQRVACKLPSGHLYQHRADLGSGYEWVWPVKASIQ